MMMMMVFAKEQFLSIPQLRYLSDVDLICLFRFCCLRFAVLVLSCPFKKVF